MIPAVWVPGISLCSMGDSCSIVIMSLGQRNCSLTSPGYSQGSWEEQEETNSELWLSEQVYKSTHLLSNNTAFSSCSDSWRDAVRGWLQASNLLSPQRQILVFVWIGGWWIWLYIPRLKFGFLTFFHNEYTVRYSSVSWDSFTSRKKELRYSITYGRLLEHVSSLAN